MTTFAGLGHEDRGEKAHSRAYHRAQEATEMLPAPGAATGLRRDVAKTKLPRKIAITLI